MKFKHTAALLFAAFALSGCFNSKYTADYNQKITLHINTPDGIVQASTVLRIVTTRYERPLFATDTIWVSKFAGETVAIQLADRWLTMALDPRRFGAAYKSIPKPEVGHVSATDRRLFLEAKHQLQAIETSVGKVFDLPETSYPDLLSFSDLQNPATVVEVDAQNLAATFGEGYALEKVTLTVTGEPMNIGVIESFMPWLPENGGLVRIPEKPLRRYRLLQGSEPRGW